MNEEFVCHDDSQEGLSGDLNPLLCSCLDLVDVAWPRRGNYSKAPIHPERGDRCVQLRPGPDRHRFAFLLWPRRTSAVRGKITVAATDVPAINAPPFLSMEGRFYLAHNEDGLLALSWRCTHMGCRTLWQGPVASPRAFECPCHASTFAYNGVRTDGPARRPFDLMKLSVNGDGSVIVNTESLSSRSRYAPSQAVPYPV